MGRHGFRDAREKRESERGGRGNRAFIMQVKSKRKTIDRNVRAIFLSSRRTTQRTGAGGKGKEGGGGGSVNEAPNKEKK